MTLNILTPTERAARDHRLDCPPAKYDADDGDARRCPHGVWFVYEITQRSGERGQGGYSEAGRWRPATLMQRRRVRKQAEALSRQRFAPLHLGVRNGIRRTLVGPPGVSLTRDEQGRIVRREHRPDGTQVVTIEKEPARD